MWPFKKYAEIEVSDGKGGFRKVKIPQEQFDQSVSEGKTKKISDACRVHIVGPDGPAFIAYWKIPEEISEGEYNRFKHSDGDIYVIYFYKEGIQQVNLVPKHVWDSANI
jgi:hypothetical protein